MKIASLSIQNGDALNNARDDLHTRGYKFSCIYYSDNNNELLLGMYLSADKPEYDKFMFLVLYPDGNYKIADIFNYSDVLSTDKMEKYADNIYKLLGGSETNNMQTAVSMVFSFLCENIKKIKYVRERTIEMERSRRISAKEAAALYGISVQSARAFIHEHGGIKLGRDWVLPKHVFDTHYIEKRDDEK